MTEHLKRLHEMLMREETILGTCYTKAGIILHGLRDCGTEGRAYVVRLDDGSEHVYVLPGRIHEVHENTKCLHFDSTTYPDLRARSLKRMKNVTDCTPECLKSFESQV